MLRSLPLPWSWDSAPVSIKRAVASPLQGLNKGVMCERHLLSGSGTQAHITRHHQILPETASQESDTKGKHRQGPGQPQRSPVQRASFQRLPSARHREGLHEESDGAPAVPGGPHAGCAWQPPATWTFCSKGEMASALPNVVTACDP